MANLGDKPTDELKMLLKSSYEDALKLNSKELDAFLANHCPMCGRTVTVLYNGPDGEECEECIKKWRISFDPSPSF